MDWTLGNYWYLLLLLTIPFLGFVIVNFIRWRNRKKLVFAEKRFQEDLFERSSKFSRFLPILYLLAFLFLIFSIVDVLAGKEQIKSEQKLNSVFFLLDVSNSMNAEDIQPNRLTAAKNVLISTLENMKNDRVGIIVFAGEARSIMPLTTDFTAVETYIGGIETSVIKIQGTDFLRAMQEAVVKFKNVPKGSRQVVLISDGEDNEGNDKAALSLAKKEGIRVTSVGIGTEEGAPVPEYLYGQLMGYKIDMTGQTVHSKRETQALTSIANGSGGSYVDGNSLNDAPKRIISSINEKAGSSTVMIDSQNAVHYYQYFLAVSLLLFLLIYLLNPKRDFNI